MTGKLVLENGVIMTGRSFGYEGDGKSFVSLGEIVFNTSMSGYQEILSDPSYCEQIVCMTYPLIGNYGITDEDMESAKVQVSGFVVREYQPNYSNFRASGSLGDFLKEQKIVAVEEVDTRRLTRLIREEGALRGAIAVGEWDDEELLQKVRQSPGMSGQNLAEKVSTKEIYSYPEKKGEEKYHVVALDLGIKTNILRMLSDTGCFVTVVPVDTPASKILGLNPDGIFLSNGPGDPAAVKNAVQSVKEMIGKKPIFGICLGHQILSLAFGSSTYKLKFGHRGGNHPVKNLATGTIEITSQNHGFAVDGSKLPSQLEVTHVNLNDETVEGIKHRSIPAFSVQYHPESSPGPHDSRYLFQQFVDLMNGA